VKKNIHPGIIIGEQNPTPGETPDNSDIQLQSNNELRSLISALKVENQSLKEKNAILQQRDDRFKLFSTNSPDTILFQNCDLVYIWVINSTQFMAVEHVIGKTDAELLSSPEARRVIDIKKGLLVSGGNHYEEIVTTTGDSRHHFSMYYQAWHDASGKIMGIATFTRDISEQKLAEKNLRQQLEGEELVAAISAQFINAEIAHIDNEIPAALQKMASYLDADRGFIRFLEKDGNIIKRGFEWKQTRLEANTKDSIGLPITKFAWVYGQLLNNQPIYISELSKIPREAEAEKDFLSEAGYKSIVMLPLFLFNTFSGYIGFGSEQSHPFWSEREKGLLDLFLVTIISVFERQHREVVLHESQELYQNLLSLSPNSIFLIQNGTFIFVNPAGSTLLGIKSVEEIIGKKLDDVFLTATINQNKPAVEILKSEIRISPVELSFQNQNGNTTFIELQTIPVKINGMPTTLGIGVDITHRKVIEREIEGNRNFLNNILDIAPLAIFVFDRNENRLVFFNQASSKVLGISTDYLQNLNRDQIIGLVHPSEEDNSKAINRQLDVLPLGQVMENEFHIVRQDGEISWLHAYQTPISKKEDGITLQSLTIVQDITEIKNAQENLLISEENYRGLVENIPGIVYQAKCDDAFTTIYISDNFEKVTKFSKQDILFNNKYKWMDLIHPEDRIRLKNCIDEAILNQTSFEIEYRLQKADAAYMCVNDSGRIIFDENNVPEFIHGIMTDISDRKRDYEEMLRLSQENFRLMTKAYHDSETKTLLLNEVNHRVKNNLSSILGILELEKKREVQSPVEFQNALSDISSRISGLAKVHEILTSNQWAPVQLDILVRKVIENASASSPIGRKLQLDIRIQDKNIWINSRQATALALILNELTTNSIRHAFNKREKGAITVTIWQENRKSRRVCIEFVDDGPGWPQSILSGNSGGVGLQVIQLSATSPLNGEIKFENRGGAAAIITFTIAPSREMLPTIFPEPV
jgi:PAS domain S-box-containing protein